jgi:hypothetical protein
VSPALPQISGKEDVQALDAAGFEHRSTRGSHASHRPTEQSSAGIGDPRAAGPFGYRIAVLADAHPELDGGVRTDGGTRHLLRWMGGVGLAFGVVPGLRDHAVDLQLEDGGPPVAPVVIEAKTLKIVYYDIRNCHNYTVKR